MTGPTVQPESAGTTLWGHTVSDLQDDISVSGGAITGTLKYVSSGTLAHDWGPGNFLAVKFTSIDTDATSVLVGLEPSVSSGLVELINDPDKNAVMKVTDKDTQKFVVVTRCDGFAVVERYDLSGLTVESES